MIDNIQEKRVLQLQPMLRKRFGKALGDFSMIEEGDRILVGLSGGKDSLFLLAALAAFRKKSPRRFELGHALWILQAERWQPVPFLNSAAALT